MTKPNQPSIDRFGPGGTLLFPIPDEPARHVGKTLFLCSPAPDPLPPQPIAAVGNDTGQAPAVELEAGHRQQLRSPAPPSGPKTRNVTIGSLIGKRPSLAASPREPAVGAHAPVVASPASAADGDVRVALGPGAAPFRQEALRARYEEAAADPLPQVTTSRWTLLLVLGALVFVLSAIAYYGQVEVTSKALGSLRVATGPTAITVQASGVVTSLKVKAGDAVSGEQLIASIEAKDLNARVERTARQVELLREEGAKAQRATEALQQETIEALERERGLLWQRAKLKQKQVAARSGHAERVRELARQGAASEFEALRAEEAASVAREELLQLRQQAAEIGVQLADRKHAYGSERLEREFQVREAEVGLTEAQTLAVLGQVRAPEAGRVESLLVSEGEVVQAGTTVARIIPSGGASSAVVFAPASDSAFLRQGLPASLEFPSLPVSEYGKARAKVTRVGNDLALPAEIRSVPGADLTTSEGLIRVELSVVDDPAWTRMQPLLHSGAPVVARIETRKRRIITLVFDFLRSWYPDS